MIDSLPDPACIGFDIGGANLKLFHTDGIARSVPFAMWKHPQMLAEKLCELVAALPPANAWLVTMTGELADCFEDRSTGVRFIVEQVEQAAKLSSVGSVLYYAIPDNSGADDGCIDSAPFVEAAVAVTHTDRIASANWHATATQIASESTRSGAAIVVDIGSTTTDLIPIREGKVATSSRTDFDRLAADELVYLGGERTPVCSLVSELPWRDRMIPIMREFFADIGDCACLLGLAAQDDEGNATCEASMTADGRPRTVAYAHARLARMIGRDADQVDVDDARQLAQYVVDQARSLIHDAIEHLDPGGNCTLIRLGHHGWLLSDDLLADRTCFEACELQSVSRVGPAFALCQLYRRQAALKG